MSRIGEDQQSPHWLMILAFPVFGAFFVFHAVQIGCFSWSRTLTGVQTRGVVTGWSQGRNEHGDGAPVVRYQVGGISYEIQGTVTWSPPWHSVGDTVRVSYMPGNPGDGRIEEWSEKVPCLMYYGGGSAFVAIGLFLWRHRRRTGVSGGSSDGKSPSG